MYSEDRQDEGDYDEVEELLDKVSATIATYKPSYDPNHKIFNSVTKEASPTTNLSPEDLLVSQSTRPIPKYGGAMLNKQLMHTSPYEIGKAFKQENIKPDSFDTE